MVVYNPYTVHFVTTTYDDVRYVESLTPNCYRFTAFCIILFYVDYFVTRPVGFDIAQGEKVLSSGDILGPAELGLLASVGVTKVISSWLL